MPDKILAAAHAKYYNQPQQQGRKPNDDAILNRRPDYCEVSSDEEDDDDCQSGGYQDVSMSEDEGPVVSYSVEDMGGPGSAYNDADFFMAAKHMAYFPNWDSAGFGERYEPLGRMVCHLQACHERMTDFLCSTLNAHPKAGGSFSGEKRKVSFGLTFELNRHLITVQESLNWPRESKIKECRDSCLALREQYPRFSCALSTSKFWGIRQEGTGNWPNYPHSYVTDLL